jgi:hypothetical protein
MLATILATRGSLAGPFSWIVRVTLICRLWPSRTATWACRVSVPSGLGSKRITFVSMMRFELAPIEPPEPITVVPGIRCVRFCTNVACSMSASGSAQMSLVWISSLKSPARFTMPWRSR